MNSIRAFIKTVLVICTTLLLYSCLATGYLVLQQLGKETGRWRNYWLTKWGETVCRILSIRVTVEGEIPKPPFFLVSNHLSYIDIILLYNVLDTTFVSKAEVKSWPVIGFMAQTLGVVFIDRRKKSDVVKANRAVADQITNYKGLVLFPEGTTSDGTRILPFKPSILEHPAKCEMPVRYAYLSYNTGPEDPSARESVCWWRDEPFGKHFFEMAKLHSIDAYIHLGSKTVCHSDRKELAKDLFQKMNQLHEKISHKPVQQLRYQEKG